MLFPDALLQHLCFVLRVTQSKPLGFYSFEIACLLIEKKYRDGAQGWEYGSVARVLFSVACIRLGISPGHCIHLPGKHTQGMVARELEVEGSA